MSNTTEKLTILVTPALRKKIERACRDADRTISWWGAKAMEEKLERETAK